MKGVLLVNLGSPDSPTAKDVKPYLDEFLMDERVIDVPNWLRNILVRGIILQTRPKKSAEAYAKNNGDLSRVQLQFQAQVPAPILYPNVPNPFDEQTRVDFSLPASSVVQIRVTDRLGRVFYKNEKGFETGKQSVILEGNDLPEGLLLLSLKTKWGVLSKKMMVLKK